MNRVLGRFRLLLPPTSFCLAYALIYLALNSPVYIWNVNNRFMPPPPNITGPRRFALVLGLLAYGLYRATAFHPYFRNNYRRWLESTPWTWRKPLPVGPVRVVWEDAIIVATMSAPAWYFEDFSPLATFSLPLGAYLIALSFTFVMTGAWGFHIATLFAVGLGVRLWDGPEWAYTAAILLAWAFGSVGLGRSLKHWPWTAGFSKIDANHVETLVGQNPIAQTTLGWPYDRLGPRKDPPMTPRRALDGFFAALLLAWWFYAGLALVPESGRLPLAMMLLLNGTLVGSLFRISRYATGYTSPLSLVGRIVRLKPIIPSYDQIFMAPLAAMFVALAGPWMLARIGVPLDASAAISFGLALMALILGGPDRLRWQLTAKHRVIPAMGNASKTQGGFIQVG